MMKRKRLLWIFSLFSALGKAAEDIKAELTRRNEKIKLNEYNIPKEIANVATVEALRQITYESNKEDYIKDFTKKDAADLEALKSKSQIEKNKLAIRIKMTQIDSLDELLNYFKRFEVFYSKDNFDKIATLESMWATQKGAYNLSKKLLEENIDYIDKKEQNDKAWRELWKAARTLYDGMNPKNIDYTSDGGICPLCHQRITYSVSKRMKTIDEYVNGKTSTAEQQAKLNYKQLLNYPQTMDTDELVKKTGEFEPEFKKVIEKVNSIILENKMNIDNFKDDVITIKTLILDDVIIPIKIKINYLQSIVKNFKKINEVDDQKEIIKSIHILEAKKTIKENELKIDENIKKLKDKHLFDEAIKKTSTNKLTTKSKELAKELITDAYVKCFNDELNKLSASGLTAQIVQGNGKKGKVPYKVQLRDAGGNMISPKDILSEGENRAVSLAAFFAEASRRTENSPLIIDDPISSLDYEYEARVISRLAEAAQKRQVIIFTHRISFVVGISDIIGDRTLFNELSLKSTKNRKGIPSEPDINARKADRLLNDLINDNLSKLKRKNELDNDFNIARHYLCQQFRNCVEKSVEEVLIGKVVMRFRKDVQTKRIKYLPSITQEDCDLVDEMMTKYSAYDHSMSIETPLIEFPVSDIEADMTKFNDWMRKRRKIIT
ncbi:AAA family ATPase [Pectinatus frisingensis]|uniref:AAA family ATPase n=1 Tax=Pectinatus frisingensis TaxID=865 RepID=UPI003D804561